MTRDKPKVTIDLEEYNELIQLKSAQSSDEKVITAKIVIAAILNNRTDTRGTVEELKRLGIDFGVTQISSMSDGRITADNIYFNKKTQP